MASGLLAPSRGLTVPASPLVYVRGDSVIERVRRRGRFSVTRQEAASFLHLQAAVAKMQDEFVKGIKRAGYEYINDDWEFRGPLPHIEFGTDGSSDSGPVGRPQLDQSTPLEWAKWERAEKSRKARLLGQYVEMVDYELVATFEIKRRGKMLTLRTQSR